MATPNPAKGASTRRGFLGRLWLWLGGLAVLEGLWITGSILKPRSNRSAADDDAVVVAGPVDRFDPGTVTAFPAGRFYLSRLDNGGFLALSRSCTHLGCTVPWVEDEGRFVCPCHASSFDCRGEVLSPPATRALDLHPVRIENGVVKVDTSTTITRQAFAPSQVVRS
ncbi:MAG: Rieske (2Fe-2S) protein [Thermoanaerobaculales bacterium]|jgi:cytochrome b6-f complex iron-sulfur subunit|nr:Rieske (2Fe-2S) protein [Thermoanaerobaculales bacterium]